MQIIAGETTRQLWKETREKINNGARLQRQNALVRRNLQAVLTNIRTSRRARRLRLLRRRAKARAICFPTNTFTLHDLQHLNPMLDPGFVRVGLAAAIRSGEVEFVEVEERAYGGLKDMAYCARTGGRKGRR